MLQGSLVLLLRYELQLKFLIFIFLTNLDLIARFPHELLSEQGIRLSSGQEF